MDKSLPTVLITGASSGIGRELARVFAKNHYQLILVARDRAKLEELGRELHQQFLVATRTEVCDLSNREELEIFIKKTRTENLVVDVLVNNAGTGVEGLFSATEWRREREMLDVNITALVRLTKAFLPQMVERRSGRILQMASTAAFQPGPFLSVYFASKAFVLSFSEAIATELKGSGVTVTAFCPGLTHTSFESKLGLRSNLFGSGLPVSNSVSVAEHAFADLMRGKRVGIHGLLNRVLSVLVLLVPKFVTLFILGRMTGKKSALRSRHSEDVSTP